MALRQLTLQAIFGSMYLSVNEFQFPLLSEVWGRTSEEGEYINFLGLP